MKFRQKLFWIVSLVAMGMLVPAWLGLRGHPELAVRTTPLSTHGGLLRSASPLGQRFYNEGPGLRRIDIPFVSLRPNNAEIELILRADDARGEILRRVTMLPRPKATRQSIAFRFDPIGDSTDRWYHFELVPANDEPIASHSAWIRFHGRIGRNMGWGTEVLESSTVESSFKSPLDNLRAIAIGCEFLSSESGAVQLELWEPEADVKRTALLPLTSTIRMGYAFFSFPPISKSAGRTYNFRITAPQPAKFNARRDTPTFKTLHGLPGSRPGMGGITESGQLLPDRDLVFRTWSTYTWLRGFKTTYARAGWRLWAAIACWIASVVAIVQFLFSTPEPEQS